LPGRRGKKMRTSSKMQRGNHRRGKKKAKEEIRGPTRKKISPEKKGERGENSLGKEGGRKRKKSGGFRISFTDEEEKRDTSACI